MRWVDADILRFADSIASADITRQQLINVYRANFSSKELIYYIFEFYIGTNTISQTKFMLQLSELSSTVPLNGSPVPPLAPWNNFTRDCFPLTVKGAPEVFMPRCSHVVGPSDGVPIPISPAILERITDIQEKWYALVNEFFSLLTELSVMIGSEGQLIMTIKSKTSQKSSRSSTGISSSLVLSVWSIP